MTDAPSEGTRRDPAHYPTLISDSLAAQIDEKTAAQYARMTHGLDLQRIALAYFDWAAHLGMAPGKMAQLAELWTRQNIQLSCFALRCVLRADPERAIEPEPQDRRFSDAGWRHLPFSLFEQYYLMRRQWWTQATTQVRGLSPRNENMVRFYTRLAMDCISPSNVPLLNPQVLRTTRKEKGTNLLRGAKNWVTDLKHKRRDELPEHLGKFRVGENLAVTRGHVVYRNRLIELIRYEPTTARVHPEPILIVPAWIMKYYILDLSEGKSMVRYLLDQGHTVFIISWRNPTKSEHDLGMDDYHHLGSMAALDEITRLVPDRKIHAMGYCVGGTLMSITAAALARDGDERLATLTLLAAQTDFTEPGELSLFIDESQLYTLENLMKHSGYLDKNEMAGAFRLLRANDLIWQPILNSYLLGRDAAGIDLMAWNADATRMPYQMHRQYLKRLYQQNQLATGKYLVDGRPIALRDIRIPIFAVGTEKDHIAPWQSVYKINLLSGASELTFLLTSGGHNAGIVTPPGHPRRHYRVSVRKREDVFQSAEDWFADNTPEQGSWWPVWQRWLKSRSGHKIKPPKNDQILAQAPGTYVFQK